MREIKFRAKIRNNYDGGWDYAKMDERHCLYWDKFAEGHQLETLGQFTGLHDKNRIEIWEGDVIQFTAGYYKAKRNQIVIDVVVYGESAFIGQNTKGVLTAYSNIEVIGNVYENPELLTKKE